MWMLNLSQLTRKYTVGWIEIRVTIRSGIANLTYINNILLLNDFSLLKVQQQTKKPRINQAYLSRP
jgi:hypothetical protein